MELSEFQQLMRDTYGERDRARGVDRTFAWVVEEVGELSRAIRRGAPDNLVVELSDVLAWLASLADQLGVSLDEAAARYADGCPKCGARPCVCG